MADEPGDTRTPLEEALIDAVDQALDLFVYAPLGLALFARDHLPALVERGRRQVEQQANLARMMGQYAVKEAEKDLRGRVERVRPRTPPTPSGAAPAPATPPARAEPASNGRARQSDTAEAGTPKATTPKPTGDHLAIPGYDTLSASQIVQRLPGLAPGELDDVHAYEESTRGRRTILSKIAQLRTGA